MAHPLFLLLTDTFLLLVECILALWESIYRWFVPPEPKTLRGEIALVTGAGHGIGRELAIQLSRLGVGIVCWDLNETWCTNVVKEVQAEGGRAWAFKCDVANKVQVQEVAEKTR
jgi:all-trans-retinol dehydrogenase (NAD+)